MSLLWRTITKRKRFDRLVCINSHNAKYVQSSCDRVNGSWLAFHKLRLEERKRNLSWEIFSISLRLSR